MISGSSSRIASGPGKSRGPSRKSSRYFGRLPSRVAQLHEHQLVAFEPRDHDPARTIGQLVNNRDEPQPGTLDGGIGESAAKKRAKCLPPRRSPKPTCGRLDQSESLPRVEHGRRRGAVTRRLGSASPDAIRLREARATGRGREGRTKTRLQPADRLGKRTALQPHHQPDRVARCPAAETTPLPLERSHAKRRIRIFMKRTEPPKPSRRTTLTTAARRRPQQRDRNGLQIDRIPNSIQIDPTGTTRRIGFGESRGFRLLAHRESSGKLYLLYLLSPTLGVGTKETRGTNKVICID